MDGLRPRLSAGVRGELFRGSGQLPLGLPRKRCLTLSCTSVEYPMPPRRRPWRGQSVTATPAGGGRSWPVGTHPTFLRYLTRGFLTPPPHYLYKHPF